MKDECESRISQVNGQIGAKRATSEVLMPNLVPRLLVSVRSEIEAGRAVAGGAEILDVKEPARGSLGMAGIDEISQISKLESVVSGAVPLSVALGEVFDWNPSSVYPVLPSGITFAKLGFNQCSGKPEWRMNWQRVRTAFERLSASHLKWVAVAYADSVEAASPSLTEVLDAAVDSGCAGLLIDTWTKRDKTLFDFTESTTLTAIATTCHSAGLFFAVAGRLGRDALPTLACVPVDVVAIRSAACAGTERTSELDSARVTEFRRAMQTSFGQSGCHTPPVKSGSIISPLSK